MVLTGTSPEAAPPPVTQLEPCGPAGMHPLTGPAGMCANLPASPHQERARDSRSDVSISDVSAGRSPCCIQAGHHCSP